MMTAKEIKCNFGKVFALFNTVEEIKDLANNICAQVKNAYEVRERELMGMDETDDVLVEIEMEEQVKETPKIDKAASKTARAKEMAAKFKKEQKNTEKVASTTKPKKETKAEVKTEPKKENTEKSDDLIAITDMAAIKKLGLTFEKYNERCYVLRGNTKPLRKALKEFKGVYNGRLTGGEGWVIANKHAESCAKALGLKYTA